jgi:hypothetical protein
MVSTRARRKDGRGSLKSKSGGGQAAASDAPVVEEKVVKATKSASKGKGKSKAKAAATAAAAAAAAAAAETTVKTTPVDTLVAVSSESAAASDETAAPSGAEANTTDRRTANGAKRDGISMDNVRGLTRSRFLGYVGGPVTEAEKDKLASEAGDAKPVWATSNVSGKWWKTLAK